MIEQLYGRKYVNYIVEINIKSAERTHSPTFEAQQQILICHRIDKTQQPSDFENLPDENLTRNQTTNTVSQESDIIQF